MPGKQAKLLTDPVVRRALRHLSKRHSAERDLAIFLLSLRAGLRACEIAALDWSMLLDPLGRVGTSLTVENRIAKKGGGRRIPLHPELRTALLVLARIDRYGPVIRSMRSGRRMEANSLVNWFKTLFHDIGASGCSSHSGRRTFITLAARNAHRAGASLRDIQLLAGHRSIEVTQGYIDGDSDAQRRLVLGL